MERVEKQILRALSWKPMDIWELMNYQDAHVKEYFEKVADLIKSGYIRQREQDGKLELTESAQKYKPVIRLECPSCERKEVSIKGTEFEDLYNKFLKIAKDRPRAVEEYDQGFIRPIDTMGRVAFMYERGDLEGNRIFLLGDDDLTGIAAAMTGMPEEVVMVDIDKRLIDFENKVAKELGLNLKAMVLDARKELPPELAGNFDVFLTDPPETESAWVAFLSRAVSALNGIGSAGYFGLTHREASLKKWRKFQGYIHDMGFAITDIIRDFQIYPEDQYHEGFWDSWGLWKLLPVKATHTETDWYKSSLIRIEAVDEIRPVVTGEIKMGPEFYQDEESIVTPNV